MRTESKFPAAVGGAFCLYFFPGAVGPCLILECFPWVDCHCPNTGTPHEKGSNNNVIMSCHAALDLAGESLTVYNAAFIQITRRVVTELASSL